MFEEYGQKDAQGSISPLLLLMPFRIFPTCEISEMFLDVQAKNAAQRWGRECLKLDGSLPSLDEGGGLRNLEASASAAEPLRGVLKYDLGFV